MEEEERPSGKGVLSTWPPCASAPGKRSPSVMMHGEGSGRARPSSTPRTRPSRTRTSSRGSGLARGSRPTSRPGSSAGPTSATPPWPRCSGTTPSLPAPPRPATSPPARPRRSCSLTSPWRVAGPPAVVAATAREVDVVAGPHPLRERRRGALGLLPSSPTLPVRSTSSAVLTPSGRGAAGGHRRRRSSCRRCRRRP